MRDGGIVLAVASLLLLLVLLLASWLEYLVSLRLLGIALGLAVATGLCLHLVVGLRRLARDEVIARVVGRNLPHLRSDIVSVVELQRQIERGGHRFSVTLYEALAHQTWRRLRRVPLAALVPVKALTPVAITLCCCALTWAAAAATMPDRVGQGARRLLAPSLDDGIEEASMMLVGDLKLSYRYPRHMGRADQLVVSSTGHISAPKGARVTITATTLVPVTRASLVVSDRGHDSPARSQLTLRDQRYLTGAVDVVADGRYRFEVETVDGRLVLDPAEHRITLEPDAVPRVTLFGPRSGLEVTARHRLEIGFTAEDDYGIIGVDLVHQVSSNPPRRVGLWRPGRGGESGAQRARTASARHDWDLETVDTYPGATVSYWVEARDNDTVSGPKTGRSATLRFSVYSPEKKHGETLRQHELLVEQGLQNLADRLLLFAAEPALSPTLQLEQGLSIHGATGTLVDGLRELRNKVRQDPLVSRTQLREIGQMHRRLLALLASEAAQLKAVSPVRRRHQIKAVHLVPLREQNSRLVAEMEQDILLLANLLDEQRLQSLMTLGRGLEQARKRLAELLERYRKTRDETLRREILRQIARMHGEMERLLAQMSKLNATIPDEYLNREALATFDLRQDLSALSGMIKAGKLGQIEDAMRGLDQKLQQIQGMLAGNLSQYRQGRMSAREQAYAATLDKLRGMESEQREIARRTGQVIRRYHQRAAQLMKHQINPFVRRELKKLARLSKKIQEIDGADLALYDQEQLSRIKQRVRDLRGMLDQGDLDEGLRMAMRTRNGLQILQDDMSEELEGQYAARRGRLQRTVGKVRSARRLAEEIVADLKGIFPHPRTLLDRQDREALRQLQRRQRALRRRVQQLQTQLEKAPGAGGLGAELPQGLRETGGLMEQAGNKLRGLQPQESHGSQEGAAERLARLRKQAESARQPRQWSQMGPSLMRQRIEIPGADAFKPPREFRQDLLEAMKERPPDAYEGQVKRYYRDLVR